LKRVLRIKLFLGSTTEQVQQELDTFLAPGICPSNYIDFKLNKLGNVYQGCLVYAELVAETQTVTVSRGWSGTEQVEVPLKPT
jgi:hypothetical protein